MTDRPILMHETSVRAMLAGRKFQTRLIITRKPALDALSVFGLKFLMRPGCADLLPYAVGDTLWVREALYRDGDLWRYRADDGPAALSYGDPRVPAMVAWAHHKEGRVCSSIHMPRWASRLMIPAVTSVRVERLQDISEADAIAEGMRPQSRDSARNGGGVRGWAWEGASGAGWPSAREAYRNLWALLHGPDSWEANPFAAVYSLERVEHRNIDEAAP